MVVVPHTCTSLREKIASETGCCRNLLESVIIAASLEKLRVLFQCLLFIFYNTLLKPDSLKFFENLVRHFALLYAMRVEPPHKLILCNV